MNRACATRLVGSVLLVTLGLIVVAGWGSGDGIGRSVRTEGAATAPDGTILFTRMRTDGKPALFTIAADGSGLRLFVTKASSAAMSQDGKQILFVRDDAIWQMRRDGSGQRQVTRPPRSSSDSDPAWAPGGQVMYFSRMVEQGSFAAFSVRVDGTGLRRLTRGCDGWCTGGDDGLAPSPDGRVIAYTSWGHGGGDDWSSISAMTPTGREARLGFRTTEASHEWSPAWAPDGERLALAALDAGAYDSNRVGLSGIYVATRSASARRVFRPGNRSPYVDQPAWSADGRWIAFTRFRNEQDTGIWLVPADGGPARRATGGKAVDREPVWLPPAAP